MPWLGCRTQSWGNPPLAERMRCWKLLSKAKDEASDQLRTLLQSNQNSPTHKTGRKVQVLKPTCKRNKWEVGCSYLSFVLAVWNQLLQCLKQLKLGRLNVYICPMLHNRGKLTWFLYSDFEQGTN